MRNENLDKLASWKNTLVSQPSQRPSRDYRFHMTCLHALRSSPASPPSGDYRFRQPKQPTSPVSQANTRAVTTALARPASGDYRYSGDYRFSQASQR